MKRKLDEKDVPTPVEASSPDVEAPPSTFESFGLDKRLLQSVREAEYSNPTAVQCQAIPPTLQGKDVVARAHTGSGKTAAYVLPVLQSILQHKQSNSKSRATLALLLVPTKELARQVTEVVNQLASHCSQQVRTLNLSEKTADSVVRAKLEETPEVVVATPARAMAHVVTAALKLDSLLHLVIDEADLMLTYDHGQDLDNLGKAIPQSVQRTLMSATVSTELDSLEKMFCHDPTIIAVEPSKEETERMQQLAVLTSEQDKFLYLYAIFKLNLVKGKCLVFVHDIDRCYRLKLYLEQFGVRSCVLNSELPVNTRIHTVEEFNKNVYRIIIAADENEAVGNEGGEGNDDDADGGMDQEDEDQATKSKKISKSGSKKPKKKTKRDREYGVARGIDFKHVELVLNFDLPLTPRSYVHRIGRTARAGRSGLAVSFAVPTQEFGRHRPTSHPATATDEAVLTAIEADQSKRGLDVRRWGFEDADVRQFEYRCGDALRAVTRAAVREARTRELRAELLNSERLQRHFAENPDELAHLRHDAESHAVRTQPHLRHVPEYLLPKRPGADVQGQAAAKALGFVGPGKTSENGIRRRHRENKMRKRGKVMRDRQGRKDPLRTFNAKGRVKK